MIKLTMTEKGGEPKALSFDKDEVTIGRVSGNDIVLPKGNVSKRHSKLTLKDGHVEIADLKSTNGTYVNGKKITEVTPVGASDRVYVGDFLITIDGLAGEGGARSSPRPSSSSACDEIGVGGLRGGGGGGGGGTRPARGGFAASGSSSSSAPPNEPAGSSSTGSLAAPEAEERGGGGGGGMRREPLAPTSPASPSIVMRKSPT